MDNNTGSRVIATVVLFANLGLALTVPLVISAIRPWALQFGVGRSGAFEFPAQAAPLALLCVLVGMGPGRPWLRASAFVMGTWFTSIAMCKSPWPADRVIEHCAVELALVFLPTYLITAAASAYSQFRFGPKAMSSQKITIAGLIFATAAIGGLIAWTLRVTWRQAESYGDSQVVLDADRLEIMVAVCVVSPLAALLLMFSTWCGMSKTRWGLLLFPPLAVMFTLMQFGSIRAAVECSAGVFVAMVWVSANVTYLSYAGWTFSRRGTT